MVFSEGRGVDADTIRLSVLGRFGVELAGDPIEVASPGQRVLAVLAIGGGAADRHRLAGTVWPDRPEGRALANLRSAIWRLPGSLRVALDKSAERVRLDRSWRVDLDDAVAAAASLRSGILPAARNGAGRTILAADLLPDWDMECLVVARERHRQLRLHALEDLTTLEILSGSPLDAVDTALAAIAAEPLRETAQLLLLKAHTAAGNRAEVVRAYEAFRRLLAAELQLEPGPQLRAAYEKAVHGL